MKRLLPDSSVLNALVMSLVISLAVVSSSHAASREVKYMVKGGAYGLLVGTALGLTSYPISGTNRTIFLGSSMGLLIGMGAGLYYGLHKEEIDSQIRAPLSLDDEPSRVSSQARIAAAAALSPQSPIWQAQYPVFAF